MIIDTESDEGEIGCFTWDNGCFIDSYFESFFCLISTKIKYSQEGLYVQISVLQCNLNFAFCFHYTSLFLVKIIFFKRNTMKRLFYLILCCFIFVGVNANHTFKFIDNKDDQGFLCPEFLQQIIDVFNVDTFVETGTYTGDTALHAAKFFKDVHTIELHKKMYKQAKKRFQRHENIHIYHGDSSETLKHILPSMTGNIILWLDAHYSGENTAMSFDNPEDGNAITAIRRELAAIQESGINDCVILIDDILGFGAMIDGQEFASCWAYPSIQEICDTLRTINHNFEFALLGDTLISYDKTKHTVALSPIVQACTKSRLFDGENLSENELLETEKIISKAQGNEKKLIKTLYKKTTKYKEPMFLHDLWYGLICFGSQEYKKAYKAFSKVPKRLEYFDHNRKIVDRSIKYEHPRINAYIETSANRITSET